MRIVAGKHRGRTLKVPEGLDTRPTTDRVREAVMSSVYSKAGGFEGKHVLDAFSGTGAMGLESLSRGAKHAVLNDYSKASMFCIEENARLLGYGTSEASLRSSDVMAQGLPRGRERYDIVFLDPPYTTSQQVVARLLGQALEKGLLADDCLIVYEHDEPADDEIAASGFELLDEKKYGKTVVSYLTIA